jgi:hypothetical protein
MVYLLSGRSDGVESLEVAGPSQVKAGSAPRSIFAAALLRIGFGPAMNAWQFGREI